MELYWTVVAALFAALWTIMSVIREQGRQVVEDTRAIVARLLELELLGIEHPEIHMYLSKTALESEQYFHDPQRLAETEFYKAKSFIYAQLDMFDEILAASAHTRSWLLIAHSPAVIEKTDWDEYMKHRMAHPLTCAILSNEGRIFGQALRNFWETHRQQIISTSPDRFSW